MLRELLGGHQIDVRLLKPAQGGIQFLRAALDAVFEVDRGLEKGKGVPLLIHRALDAADEGRIDFLQPLDLIDVVNRHHYSAATGWVFPKAMPVNVWFRCMD